VCLPICLCLKSWAGFNTDPQRWFDATFNPCFYPLACRHARCLYRDLIRSVQLDKRSGLMSFISRAPPKVLRRYNCCSRCGQQHEQDDYAPEWELWVDPTAPQGVLPVRHLCLGCALGRCKVTLHGQLARSISHDRSFKLETLHSMHDQPEDSQTSGVGVHSAHLCAHQL
jgi:hypothetical protein